MNLSLIRFLRTGSLGEIRVGWAAENIQVLLGTPDGIGKSRRKFRYTDIWLYGGVEFWLDQAEPQVCRNIWIERIGHGWQDESRMPANAITEDWDLLPYTPRDAVETYLQRSSITAFQPEPQNPDKNGCVFAPRNLVLPSSGVTLGFDENWLLNHLLAAPLT